MSASQASAALISATAGFEHLFSNRLSDARAQLASDDSPFHLLGLGVCAFLEAALGMEAGLMAEATRCLELSEAGAKKQLKSVKSNHPSSRFPPGIEWEIMQADAIVLLGLTQALSESYMGYLQCMYSFNNAHSKFTKLFKQVFPHGLESYATPATTPAPSRSGSMPSLASISTAIAEPQANGSSRGSFFGRWGGSSSAPKAVAAVVQPEGPVEELILSGAAFGYGLFNLVFSLLPAKVKSVVGFFGFNSDRKVALQALAVSAARKDVHAVFAGLTLMTYHGVVLLLSGYQADEAHIVKQYRAIVEDVAMRYPDGSLWILNRAKILRMTYDPEGAIDVLKDGLRPGRPGHFREAESLLVFELAWTLLSQRLYQEAVDMFMKMTEMNSWSHATYYAIGAGCYISLGHRANAKVMLDAIPGLLDKKKLGGKDLPTEVFIRKKIAFYKEKQKRRGGKEDDYVDSIKITLAEELAIFWNTHARVTPEVAKAHIETFTSMTPAVTIHSPYAATPPDAPAGTPDDLDTPDELAIRAVLLGIVHRVLREYAIARAFLEDAYARHANAEARWVGGVAIFELAVLDLKEAEAVLAPGGGVAPSEAVVRWGTVLKGALGRLDTTMSISGGSVDLSSRLDTRVTMLRDEIKLKREMLGIPAE